MLYDIILYIMNYYSLYCDESGHLENDHQNIMSLSSIWCEDSAKKEIKQRLYDIKRKHNLPLDFEIKWTKVSPAKVDFYLDVIDYFFDSDTMNFRTIIINKDNLNHSIFNQTHDQWYYKMYFILIKALIDNHNKYSIYLDIKDTRGGPKIRSLRKYLANSVYDFDRSHITKVQQVRSNEIQTIQVCDLLMGAITAANRGDQSVISPAKKQIIEKIRARSGYSLGKTTLLREQKLNIFIWSGREGFEETGF